MTEAIQPRWARPGNCFYMTLDNRMDRRYVRTCVVFRLLQRGYIGQAEANEIANRPIRGTTKPKDYLKGTIEIWKRHISGMKP
jgi:hypothetical protein